MKDIIDLTASEIAVEAHRSLIDQRKGWTVAPLALIEALATRVADLEENLRYIQSKDKEQGVGSP